MYHIVICDDEKTFASKMQENLEYYAKARGLDFRFQICYDGKDLLDNYKVETDLIFMDIKMEKIDGLKAAEEIRKHDGRTGIIFLTSAAEYVWRGYEFGAFNFLLKPVKYERLEMELDRFFSSYGGKEERFLIVANDNGKFKVSYREIRYLEVEKRNVLVHYGTQRQILHKSMKETVELFCNEASFAQSHASFLVNLSFVTGVEKMEVLLSGGERIPLSYPKRKEFMLKLAEYWGSRM